MRKLFYLLTMTSFMALTACGGSDTNEGEGGDGNSDSTEVINTSELDL